MVAIREAMERKRRNEMLKGVHALLLCACANCRYKTFKDGGSACRPQKCCIYEVRRQLFRVKRENANGCNDRIYGADFMERYL